MFSEMSSHIKRNISSNYRSTNSLENILILQGGGSLGAFSCGVFKSLAKNDINLDIIAGTSIGGVNAAIIAGSKDDKHAEDILEQFWLELAESSKALHSFPSSPFLTSISSPLMPICVTDHRYTMYSLDKCTYKPNSVNNRCHKTNIII
jgi:predicted acylesterase/phospholipase RssA